MFITDTLQIAYRTLTESSKRTLLEGQQIIGRTCVKRYNISFVDIQVDPIGGLFQEESQLKKMVFIVPRLPNKGMV